ncbi:MAG TPA: DmsC/YnfH family molybdoenzyme membrane anchor subunit [Vicinamibacterales bacterium]|nr:DmsC/YnfH family molybdoenzyme membrane anchor subunit [Vicinamibacterales bacterium]
MADDGLTFALTRRSASAPPVPLARSTGDARVPSRPPEAGEQYRFHVDMGACIGCKCCVVACNEQNGNPAAINWRRVGEIEGGWYPNASRSYLSMGCNHCLEPTCLSGCPVDAYTKDPETGIVRHSADACIGCQYCTWNCSYGVPQYNPERGVVGKCDMCHGRLGLGQAPACVTACPEGAIAIELVNVEQWRTSLAARQIPAGAPVGDSSLSTTRITLPVALPPNARPRDITHVTPEHPHWPLVVMTVLTQLSVGAFATVWLLHLLGGTPRLGVAALTSLMVGGLALAASTLHLGRPVYAYRAIRMWRRSWLSREVLLFSSFSGVAGLYAAALWFGIALGTLAGALTVVLGVAGVVASACIYRVPSRPAWNTPLTVLQFLLTGAVLGPLFVGALGVGDERWLATGAMAVAGAQLVLLALRFFRLTASDSLELQGTARLLSTVLARRFVLRGALLVLGAIVLPLLAGPAAAFASDAASAPKEAGPYVLSAGFLLALAGEILGRYLFFVSVVPTHMTAPYVAAGSEAA